MLLCLHHNHVAPPQLQDKNDPIHQTVQIPLHECLPRKRVQIQGVQRAFVFWYPSLGFNTLCMHYANHQIYIPKFYFPCIAGCRHYLPGQYLISCVNRMET